MQNTRRIRRMELEIEWRTDTEDVVGGVEQPTRRIGLRKMELEMQRSDTVRDDEGEYAEDEFGDVE